MPSDPRHEQYVNFKDKLTQIIGHEFHDSQLAITALTHRSLSEDNSERLEFLGDRVLALYITDMLFQFFPDDKEGALAKRLSHLVNRQTLAEVSSELNLGEFIFALKQFDNVRYQDKILADILESIIGALYIDGGANSARDFIASHFEARARIMVHAPKDAKSALQEWSMKESGELPIYEVLEQTGAAHEPKFSIQVSVKNLGSATAEGKTIKAAEAIAAKRLYKKVKA